MKNKLKKTFAAALAALTMTTAMAGSASAANYSVSYVYGRPSSLNSMGTTISVTSSGKGYIEVVSSNFSVYMTGAYILFDCTTAQFPTVSQNVNRVNTYALDYEGDAIPKSGVTLQVKYTLMNASISKTVEGSGTVTA